MTSKMEMGFEHALMALKSGHRVCRAGWNGKGMWLQVVRGMQMQMMPALPSLDPGRARLPPAPIVVQYPPHIAMKTATSELVPWLASVTDLMAEDWEVLS